MGGFDLLFWIGFEFVVAEGLFVCLDGHFAEPRSCLSEEGGIHPINNSLFIRFNFIFHS